MGNSIDNVTIENTKSIDSIGVHKNTGKVILKIFDHLDWANEYDHLILLQDKVNTYLHFLESGEVYQAYKDAQGREFVISVDFAVPPSSNVLKFLDTAAKIALDAGFELEYKLA